MVVAIEAQEIAYMPVPKAACTSIKAALSQIDPDVSVDIEELAKDTQAIHQVFETRRFRLHRWRNYEGWWRFAVVRDPLKRLLSVYTDRVVGKKELKNSPKLRKQSVLPTEPDPDFFFQHLDRYIANASTVKHHTLSYRFFLGPSLDFDRVFRIEELPDLADKLSDISGQKVTLPRFNSSSKKLTADELRPETLGFIREFLRDDYEKLSDFYPCPL